VLSWVQAFAFKWVNSYRYALVRIAMQDQHQTRGGGASSQQEAKLVSRNRKSNGGFFTGIEASSQG
jgi:hypothetical protein